MGDLYGKDMDNLKRHMGGGGGRPRKKLSKEERQKGGFTYEQEKIVYVGINGKPKQGNVIRCNVHDLDSAEELYERVSMLLFYDVPCKIMYMDDGVVLHNISILRDQDFLYASTKEEPFYGDTPPETVDLVDDDVVVDEEKGEQAKQAADEEARKQQLLAKKKLAESKPRKFFQPQLTEDTTSQQDTSTTTTTQEEEKQRAQDLLSKYGGAEHFTLTDMLSQRGKLAPKVFLPTKPSQEEMQQARAADEEAATVDASFGRKKLQKTGLTNTTETALKELMERAAKQEEEQKKIDVKIVPDLNDEEVDEKPKDKTEDTPMPVGDVGFYQLPGTLIKEDTGPPNRKQKRAEEQAALKRRKKRDKRRETKRQKREEAEAKQAAEEEARKEEEEKAKEEEDAKKQDEQAFVGPPRPPPRTGDESDSSDDAPPQPQKTTTAPSRPAAAMTPSNAFVGPPRPPPGAADDSSSEDEVPARVPQRPANAYVPTTEFVGPRPPPPGANDSSSSEEE